MRGLWVLVLVNIVAALALSAGSALAQANSPRVLVGEIKGVINPVTASYVERVISQAERQNAAAVVFTLDTPGGLADAMRDINLRILASRVPVLVYVGPDGARAGSAGVYIAYAAPLAAMAPATNIGSATPVALDGRGGEASMSPEMRNKVTNDAVAGIRALAEQRQRDPDFAERAVREGANLPASEALRANVVNYIATDLPDLLRQADGAVVHLADGDHTLQVAGATPESAGMSALESFLHTVTTPTIAYLLLSLGSLGLLLELYNPGSIFPGVIGGICVLIAFFALGTLPLNVAGLALLGFGLVLFALEPFLTSHGVLAAGGIVSFIAGSLLLINVADAPYLQIEPAAIAGVSGVLIVFATVIVVAILRGRRRRVMTGHEVLVGSTGIVRRVLEPQVPGLILVQGELWQAIAPAGRIGIGEQVIVQNVDGLRLQVRRARDTMPAPPRPAAPAAAKGAGRG